MYAAGHPPMPAFEIAAFSEQMPRHWQYLREKKDPEVQKDLGYKKGELEQTKLLLVGAAISLRETMRLLQAQAKAADKTAQLDLSNFDCYTCHHDLKSPAWLARVDRRKPGRIPMRAWPTDLARLAILHLSAQDKKTEDKTLARELEAGMRSLAQAFDARPFGDPARIAKAAGAMAAWADGLAVRINATTLYPTSARSLLVKIPELYGRDLLEYDSARQVSWAFATITNELPGRRSDTEREALREIDKAVSLRLPRAPDKLAESERKARIRTIRNYNPEAFRSLLHRLGNREK
jgi:hypothetical protein